MILASSKRHYHTLGKATIPGQFHPGLPITAKAIVSLNESIPLISQHAHIVLCAVRLYAFDSLPEMLCWLLFSNVQLLTLDIVLP